MEKAKKKGEDELVDKREKLMVQLEKLGRRTEEFKFLSELEMMQQVEHGLCFRIPLMKEFFLPFFFFSKFFICILACPICTVNMFVTFFESPVDMGKQQRRV